MSPADAYVSLSVTVGFVAFGVLVWSVAGTIAYIHLRDLLRHSFVLNVLLHVIGGPLVWVLAIARGLSELLDWVIYRGRAASPEQTPRRHGVTPHRADRSSV